jgi:acetyltransferase-like isoleucine patch superfamily enzyme
MKLLDSTLEASDIKKPQRRAVVRHLVFPCHETKRADARRRETIHSFLIRANWTFALPTICAVNGAPVLRRNWKRVRIKVTDEVVFLSRPLGGGQKSGTALLGLIAAIALAAFAPWAGAALFGAGTLLAGVASAAIAIGGGLLLNMLIKPKPGGQSNPDNETPIDQIYSVSTSGNLARLQQPLPVHYGRFKEDPDYASTPWGEFEGNDQYLNILLTLGCGKYEVHKILSDDTEVWDEVTGYSAAYNSVTHEIYEPGENVDLFPINVVQAVEVSGQELPGGSPGVFVGGFIANNSGTEVDNLAIDLVFPAGCFKINTDNGETESTTVAIEVQARKVDDAGAPLESFTQIYSHTFIYATRNPIRFTAKVAVDPGRYEVRVRRTNVSVDPNTGQDQLVWAGLRGFVIGDTSFADVSVLAIRIKATEQLSQSAANRFGVLKTRILPVWNADDEIWEEMPTRNPIWAAYDIATNDRYGLKRPPSKIDFQRVFDLAAAAELSGHTFDYVFKAAVAGPEALDMALKPFLCRHRWAGDTLTFVRDEWVETRQMLITDREIVRGSLNIEWDFNTEDSADAVIMEYVDEDTWRPAEVQYPPNTAIPLFIAENPARIRVDGVCNRERAYEMAARAYLVAQYRRCSITLDTEHDGRMLGYGSTVFLQTELPNSWGSGGEVLSRSGNSLYLDPPPVWSPSLQNWIKIRSKTGRPFGPVKVTEGATPDIAVLDTVDLAQVESDQGTTLDDVLEREDGAEAPSFSHGFGEAKEKPCIVTSGRPSGDRVTLRLVVDQEEVHEGNLGDVPVPPTPPSTVDPPAPLVVGLVAHFRQGVIEPILDASWWPAAGAEYYEAAVSYDGGVSWTPVYEGTQPRFSVVVDRAALRLRVQAIGRRRGAFSTVDVDAPEIELGPDVVSPETLTSGLRDYVTRELRETSRRVDFVIQRIASNAADQDAANAIGFQNIRVLLEAQGIRITETAEIVETEIDGKFAGVWSITTDNNGYISGIVSYNDGDTADFAVIADNFLIYKPGFNGDAPYPVFKVGTRDGISSLVMDGILVEDGSIIAASIQVGAIQAYHITANAIEAVHISAEAVDFVNANITNLTVENINSNWAIFNAIKIIAANTTSWSFNATPPGPPIAQGISPTFVIEEYIYTTETGILLLWGGVTFGMGSFYRNATPVAPASYFNVTLKLEVRRVSDNTVLGTTTFYNTNVSQAALNGMTISSGTQIFQVSAGTEVKIRITANYVHAGVGDAAGTVYTIYQPMTTGYIMFLEPNGIVS